MSRFDWVDVLYIIALILALIAIFTLRSENLSLQTSCNEQWLRLEELNRPVVQPQYDDVAGLNLSFHYLNSGG